MKEMSFYKVKNVQHLVPSFIPFTHILMALNVQLPEGTFTGQIRFPDFTGNISLQITVPT